MTRPRTAHTAALVALLGLSLGACTLLDGRNAEPAPAAPVRVAPTEPVEPTDLASSAVPTVRLITAQTPAVRSYRKLGAQHIYKLYPKRIFKGKLPPLMHAVVVVETDIDATGRVVNVIFSRKPSHAPDVPPLIEDLIRKASPLPNPGALGAHTYVDTWLWDKSGNFQIDSVTEGQRSR